MEASAGEVRVRVVWGAGSEQGVPIPWFLILLKVTREEKSL